ncbi:receptor-type tyrosine-protein phosphatase H [Rhinophrynus dorsalis]
MSWKPTGRCAITEQVGMELVCPAPPAVTSVTLQKRTETLLTVRWEAPDNTVTSYNVVVELKNGTIKLNESTTLKEYNVTGLSPGETYNITIYAVNGNGTSGPSPPLQATTMPSKVSGFVVSGVSVNAVNLTWTTPSDTNVATYTYTVEVRQGGASIRNITLLNTNSTVVTGLSPGENYTFTIYTVTSNGIRSGGSDVTTTTNLARYLKFVKALQNFLLIDTNVATYTYTVEVRQGGASIRNITGLNTNSTMVTGLSPGENYTFTIYTVTSNGIWSERSDVTTTTLPSKVTEFKVSGVSVNAVNLKWTAPNDTNVATYTYTVEVRQGGASIRNITGLNTNSTMVTELSPGENYTFTIYTVTSNGIRSERSDVTTTTMPSKVTEFKVSGVSVNAVNLKWTAPNDTNVATYTYTVEVRQGGASIRNITGLNTNSTMVTELSPGENYTFTIYTVTSNGIRSERSDVTTTTMPSKVSGFVVSGVSVNAVNLKWTTPSDTNVATYTYTVEVRQGGASIRNITGLNTNSTMVTGLSPGENYTFTIYTVTSNGIRSERSDVTTTTMPSKVSDFKVSGVSLNVVNLTWTIPNDTNRESYTYTVEVSQGGASIRNITDIQTNSKTVSELSPGQTYNFTIYTVTSNGVRSERTDITATTRPTKVTGFKVSGVSVSEVNLTWTVPSDSNDYTYTVEVIQGGTTIKNISGIKTDSTNVSELSPGENYTFTIYIVTPNGIKSDTADVTATTMPSRVSRFTASSVTVSRVTLNWTFPNDTNKATYTYTIEVRKDSTFIRNIKDITTDYAEVLDLLSGVNYTFTIYTVTSNGIQSEKTYISIITIPNQPINVNGSPNSTSDLFISWAAPNDTNKNSYKYRVTWFNALTPENRENQTVSNTNVTIGGLKPGNLYSVSVSSVIFNTFSASTPVELQTKPLSPQKVEIGNFTSTSVLFSWSNPAEQGSILSGFEFKAVTGGNSTTTNIPDSSLQQYNLTGLTPGANYIFSIRSYTETTIGAKSSRRIQRRETVVRTYGKEISKPGQTNPDAISNLQCYKVNGGYQLRVTFICPRGQFTEIKVYAGDQSEQKLNTCETNGSVIMENLQPARVIVGSIFGVLLFLLLLGLIAFFVLKKRCDEDKKKEEKINFTNPKKKSVQSVTKESFPAYYSRQHADSDFGFAEEYQQLSDVGTNQSKRAAEIPDNRAKNRFTNVLPYDHSRVKLSCIDGSPNTDYINANYMPGYNSVKEFIASQGPLPNTTADFWRMIWEHNVNTLVMLTNCVENGRPKCEHYWPLDYTPCTYGDITVTVTSETILPEWTIRDFSLKHANQQGIKNVRHFHFTAWPDHGVPDNTSNIIEFRNLVREYMDQKRSNGPTVVHCSAGVGRTGTLIALDYLMQMMEKQQCIGIYGFVEKMRMNRPLMVQTESQYVFLNKCMMDLIQQPQEENFYENQVVDLIYENASVVREYQKEKV